MMSRRGVMVVLALAVAGCSPDHVASKITGRECSAGYIQEGEDWCAPPERPPVPQPYCTQSWNGVDCWARPDLMPNVPQEVAEGPSSLTQDQNANRLHMSVKKAPPSNPYYP